MKNWNGLLGTVVSNWILCSWNALWSKLSQVLANKEHMGPQECGQTIVFLNEEGMDCKIILKHTVTDSMVPAALKYPSHNLCEVPCIICISYWKDWGAKNLMPCFYLWQPWKRAYSVALPVCLMQEISCLSLRLGYVQRMENVGSRQKQNASDKNRKVLSQVILLVERKTKTCRGRYDWI